MDGTSTGQAVPPGPGRNQAVEALRMAAAFGVVAFHAGAHFANLAYAGLIVFLILAPYYAVRTGRRSATGGRAAAMLARKLLVPWIFWLAVYGLLNLIRDVPLLAPGNPVGAILVGTSPHLWFLPFLFAVLTGLDRAVAGLNPAALLVASAMLVAGLLASAPFWRPLSLDWPPPLPNWSHAVPAVLIGVVFGLVDRVGKWCAALALVLVLAGLIVALAAAVPGLARPYAFGVALTAGALLIPARAWPRGLQVQAPAECMMGVYLAHLVALPFIAELAGTGTYRTVALTYLITLAGVWAMRRWVPGAKRVLG